MKKARLLTLFALVLLAYAVGQLCGAGPVAATGSPVPTQVSAGWSHACALFSGGTIKCWGSNGHGQLGNGKYNGSYYDSPTPVQVSGINNATQVSAGGTHTCALLSGGTVECWGDNSYGQLGNGKDNGSYYDSPTPVTVTGITEAGAIVSGERHTCALLSGGTVECWGWNSYGQLGNGTTTNSTTPVQVSGITNATQVSAGGGGGYHTCALLSGGAVECWGRNLYGQLGNGTTSKSSIPVQVSGITNATQVSTGEGHTCAAVSGGTTRCWGNNLRGQLGNGTTSNSSTPVQVSGITNATQVSLGGGHTCALLSGGTVECWGYNSYGSLGNGTTTNSSTPVQVSGITNATQVSAGYSYNCALLADSTIKCWGLNSDGQLGDGAMNHGYHDTYGRDLSPTPVVVLLETKVTGSILTGTVYDPSSKPLAQAPVEICRVGGSCISRFTSGAGLYSVVNLGTGNYTVTAHTPADHNYTDGHGGPVTVSGAAGASFTQNVTLGRPLVAPPADTTITNIRTTSHGTPVVWWDDALTITTEACGGGTGSYQIIFRGRVVRSGSMTESPSGSGHYVGTSAGLYPNTGYGQVTITIHCPGGAPDKNVAFELYIDPSGKVVDADRGLPIKGATVRLLRSDSVSGPFVPVPNGSAVMSAANRANPDTTASDGRFGWDVIAGFYKVQASSSTCGTVDSAVLNIPPAVTNLVLRLSCTHHHNLTVSKQGAGAGTVTSSPAGIACGSTCVFAFSAGIHVTLTAAPAAGSSFAGWSGGGCSGTGSCQVTVSRDATITASFSRLTAVLAFSQASYTVSEGAGAAQVTIRRTGNTSSAVSVHFGTLGSTASAGSDYTIVYKTVSFAAGQSSKTVSVPIINDSLVEGAETVQLKLLSPSAGAVLGNPHEVPLAIIDNDMTRPLSAARLQGTFKGTDGGSRITWNFRPRCAKGACSVKAKISNLASFPLTRYMETYRGHFGALVYCAGRYRNTRVDARLTIKKAADIGSVWRATYWTGTFNPVYGACRTTVIKGTLKR
jgi:alpha-tubulin suppressor-like RCC1 family protein